ncbi:MAG: hypothetical protein IKL60_02245 [Alistipes sp.]|nr:hypothetical protein [Alistipes sp.]
MNFTEIKERLQQVLQIVEENGGATQLSDLERDLVLCNLRDVYSALRFGAVEPAKVDANIEEPKATEVVVEVKEEPKVAVVAEEQPKVVEVAPQPKVEPVVEIAPEPIVEEVVESAPQPVVEVEPIVEEPVEAKPVVEPVVEEEQPVVEEPKSVDSEVAALKTRKSAMYALYEEGATMPTLGDTFGEKRALADTIAAPKGVAESRQIESLASAIGVADRFMLIRELFDNDEEAYRGAIEQLDTIGSFDDCVVYIAENFSWRANSEGAKYMMELLQRKYNA